MLHLRRWNSFQISEQNVLTKCEVNSTFAYDVYLQIIVFFGEKMSICDLYLQLISLKFKKNLNLHFLFSVAVILLNIQEKKWYNKLSTLTDWIVLGFTRNRIPNNSRITEFSQPSFLFQRRNFFEVAKIHCD